MEHGPALLSQKSDTEGIGGAETFTMTVSLMLPPGPVQVITYVCPVVRLPVDSLLDIARGPGDTHGPLVVVHPVAFVVVHESVAAVFHAILQSDTAPLQRRSNVGAAAAPTVTVTESEIEPPGPVQVMA
jgi:hypothetical protein